jgi:hypothetical protein
MIVSDTKENLEKCICKECPSYTQCMRDKNGGLFCARGKSSCEVEEEECICVDCPVDKEYKLTARLDLMEKKILKMNQFYCIKGPAGTKK